MSKILLLNSPRATLISQTLEAGSKIKKITHTVTLQSDRDWLPESQESSR